MNFDKYLTQYNNTHSTDKLLQLPHLANKKIIKKMLKNNSELSVRAND
jgi:hypothetical protein